VPCKHFFLIDRDLATAVRKLAPASRPRRLGSIEDCSAVVRSNMLFESEFGLFGFNTSLIRGPIKARIFFLGRRPHPAMNSLTASEKRPSPDRTLLLVGFSRGNCYPSFTPLFWASQRRLIDGARPARAEPDQQASTQSVQAAKRFTVLRVCRSKRTCRRKYGRQKVSICSDVTIRPAPPPGG